MNYPYYQYQQPLQTQPQTQTIQQPQTMQSGGFMSVPSEQVARNYPVAPGNVMTFKIENQPIVCEKSQGFSQLEGPTFNKYRLVKEEETIIEPPNNDIESLKEEIKLFKEEMKTLKEEIKKLNKKKGDKE